MEMDGNCKTLESKQVGNKFLIKLACTDGADSHTANVEMEDLGKDAYRGFVNMTGTRDGEKYSMRMDMSGRRVGNCDASALERKIKADQEAAAKLQREVVVRRCNEALAELDPGPAFGYGKGPHSAICPERQGEFCARAGEILRSVRTRTAWEDAASKYTSDRISSAAGACKLDLVASKAPACREAEADKDWAWLYKNACPEAAELRKRHCTKPDQSAADPKYAAMCSELSGLSYSSSETSSEEGGGAAAGTAPGATIPVDPKAGAPAAGKGATPGAGQGGAPGGAPAAGQTATVPPPEAPKKPSTADKLKEGADKLKKFLKF